MPSRLLPSITLSLCLLTFSACKKEQEPELPPNSTGTSETTKSGASIKLIGNFEPEEGAALAIVQTLVLEDGTLLQSRGENEITGSVGISHKEQQVIHILEDNRREIEIREGGTELSVRIEENEPAVENQPDQLTGKTIIATPSQTPGSETSWSYAFKDDPDTKVPPGFGAADLRADALYPDRWLTFGDEWQPEPAAVAALLGPGFQLREGKIKMKLVGFRNRRGQRCAEIGTDITAEGVFQSATSREDMKIRLKGKIYRSLHVYQDIEASLSGNLELRSNRDPDKVLIRGPVKFERRAEWKKATQATPGIPAGA